MTAAKSLTWNDRFALIDAYQPSDEQVISTFGVTQSELDTARTLRAAGTISVSKELNVKSYNDVFGDSVATSETTTSIKRTASKQTTQTSVSKETTPPESATRRATTTPKKRGRKGTKISEAFRSIPTTPTNVEDFARLHGVSIPVLRQSKRFGKDSEHLGVVRVKLSKETGKLMIWREAGE